MTTVTATAARKNFFEIIKDVSAHHHAYHIQHRTGGVVMMSEADYENLIETLELLAIPNFRKRLKKSVKQVHAGETLSMKEVFGE